LLKEAEEELGHLAGLRQQKTAAKRQLELAQHALQLVESRAQSSAAHQAQVHADKLQQQLEETLTEREAMTKRKSELEAEAAVRRQCLYKT
jgi:hypothetical protein